MFCYDCLVPFTSMPSVKLPFQLHITTHASEAAASHTDSPPSQTHTGSLHPAAHPFICALPGSTWLTIFDCCTQQLQQLMAPCLWLGSTLRVP